MNTTSRPTPQKDLHNIKTAKYERIRTQVFKNTNLLHLQMYDTAVTSFWMKLYSTMQVSSDNEKDGVKAHLRRRSAWL